MSIIYNDGNSIMTKDSEGYFSGLLQGIFISLTSFIILEVLKIFHAYANNNRDKDLIVENKKELWKENSSLI